MYCVFGVIPRMEEGLCLGIPFMDFEMVGGRIREERALGPHRTTRHLESGPRPSLWQLVAKRSPATSGSFGVKEGEIYDIVVGFSSTW